MRFHAVVLCGLLVNLTGVGGAGAAFAASPSAQKGAQISAQCAACHGSDGMSVDTSIPNLAGQHYQYLTTQIEAFKQRTRNSPLMNELTRTLTQEQIDDLAAYYASIPIRVEARPTSNHQHQNR
jgi:cytochrome c553